MVLSYIPLKKNYLPTGNSSVIVSKGFPVPILREGLLGGQSSKDIEYSDRIAEQEEILNFCADVFGEKPALNFEEYKEINS